MKRALFSTARDLHRQSLRLLRRGFLAGAAAALAAPYVVPASALGADGGAAPSERLGMGFLGVDADLRPAWQEFAANLAPLPTNEAAQARQPDAPPSRGPPEIPFQQSLSPDPDSRRTVEVDPDFLE